MAIDIATLALKVEALEVENASRKLDDLTVAGELAEKAVNKMTRAFAALGITLSFAKLGDMVREAAMAYSRYETLGAAMNTVGNNAGYTALQMSAYEKALRSTGIAMTESRETLTKMAASHIDLAHATDLARVAQDAAVIGNINSSEAFDRMINGIRSAEVEVLRGIGLNVNFQQSYEKLAKQLGRSVDSLSEAEKTQARVNSVMAAGTGIAGTYEAAMGTAGKLIKSMERYLADLQVRFGQVFGPATTLLVDQVNSALKELTSWATHSGTEFRIWGNDLASSISSVESAIVSMAKHFSDDFTVIVGLLAAAKIGQIAFNAAIAANPYGAAAAAIVAMNEALREYNLNIGSLKTSAQEGSVALGNMWDVLTGKRDFNTGRVISGVEQIQNKIAGLREQLSPDQPWYNFQIFPDAADQAAHIQGVNNQITGLQKNLTDMTYISERSGKSFSQSWIDSHDTIGKTNSLIGNVIPTIKLADDQLSKLTKNLTPVHQAQLQYKKDLEDIGIAHKAGQLTGALYSEALATAKKHLDAATGATRENKAAMSEAKKEASAHAKELQGLIDKYLPMVGAAETAAAAEKGLIELRERGVISASNYAMALQRVREALYAEQEAETHSMERQTQMADAYHSVNMAMLSDSERAIYDITDKYALLNAQIDLVVQSEPKLQQWGATAHATMGQKMADEIQKTADNASQMGKMFEDVAKNIQSAFSRMFEDMLDGTGNMMDSINSMFKRLLAQMATMAIANPIILPIITTIGSALGLSTSAIASATGTSTTQISGISGLGGISSLFSSGSLQGMGVSALAGVSSFTYNLGFNSLGSLAADASDFLAYTSSGLADGLMGGVGSLAMSLLSGQGLSASTGLQAAGSVLGGFLGGGVGAVIGGLVGDLVSGLFGTGEDTFGPQYMANGVGTNYDRTKGMVATSAQYNGGDTDSKIAKVYAEQMRSIQSAFNDQVSTLANALPEELSNAMLDNLASADLKSILNEVSGQEINVKDAESWLEGVAESYSEGLISALGTAFGSALSDFIDAKGAAGLVGDNAAWSMLTDAVQENIESAFKDAADTIAGGDITSGMTAINNVMSAIAAINSAMAPISEIIDTNGMSEYEKSLRSINNQFDTYRDALKAAGVDMEKYTDLEKARSIQLISAADDYFAAVNGQFTDALEKLNPTANIASATSQLSSLLSQAESGDFSGIDSLDSIASTLAGQDMGSYASLLDYQRSLWSSYNTVAEIERLAKANAPKFAAGGDHAGGWRTVGENGPELEYTGPSQIVSNGKASALVDNTEVVSAIKTMQNRLERMLFAVAKNSGQTTEQLKRWEYNGMPEVREAI